MKSINALSDDTCLALYFAITAARHGTTNVIISNEHLRWYFFGGKDGKRLSAQKIKAFADTLKPIFPRSLIKKTRSGHPYLVLYMTEKAGAVAQQDHVSLAPTTKAVINKTLGVEG